MKTPIGRGPQIITDAEGRIDQDTHCIKCGYNLRTLMLQGRCPECGTAVGRSVHGDLLRFRDPVWVETLANGMNWIVAGIVLSFVLGCVGGNFVQWSTAGFGNIQSTHIMVTAMQIIGQIVSLIGYWKVATPDPARIYVEPLVTARKLVRCTVVLGFVLTLIHTGLSGTQAPTTGALAQSIAAARSVGTWTLGIVIGINGVVSLFATFIYARQIALRIPDLRLAKQTRLVMWGVVICAAIALVAFALGGVLAFAGAGTPPPGTQPATGAAGTVPANVGALGVVMIGGGCVAVVGMLVFGIWSLVLIIRYRRAFKQAARQARATWASATPIARPAE